MTDRNATDAWSVMGNDSQHRYPVISPKQVRKLLDCAKKSADSAQEVRECLAGVLLEMNNVIASYKWQIKTLNAENEALRKALKQLT